MVGADSPLGHLPPLETDLQFLGHGSHSKMGLGTEKDRRLGQVVREHNIERQKQIKG